MIGIYIVIAIFFVAFIEIRGNLKRIIANQFVLAKALSEIKELI